MARMTIAQLRVRDIHTLAHRYKTDPTADDYRLVRKLMNSYYRLCGLCERNLYLANDERTCNRRSTARSEEREEKWWKRLDKQFRDTFGLMLEYHGCYLSICEYNHEVAIWPHFYN